MRATILDERATGVEPATSSLGSWHSTTELRPHIAIKIFIPPNCDGDLLQRLRTGDVQLGPSIKQRDSENRFHSHTTFVDNFRRSWHFYPPSLWRATAELLPQQILHQYNFFSNDSQTSRISMIRIRERILV